MRKFVFAIVLLLSSLGTYAASPSVITGTWNRGRDKEVSLFYIVAGRIETLASYNLQKDGKFGFVFENAQEGFYVVGSGTQLTPQGKYIFYFKPGDKLEVAVNDSTYTLVGKNTPENEALAKWHDATLLLELRSVYFNMKFGRPNGMPSTYVDFFPLLEETAAMEKNFKANTGNKKFDAVFKDFRTYDLMRYAWTIVMTPRSAHPEADDYTEFYHTHLISNYTKTAELLRYPFGMNMLGGGMYVQTRKMDKQAAAVDVRSLSTDELKKYNDEMDKKSDAIVTNDTIKGELVVRGAGMLKTYDDYQDLMAKDGKYIVTEDQKERMNAVLTKIAQTKAALQTIEFSGTDINDKKFSLSDFKGKVVVVDVWATWCGPCKKEIPALKAMEKAYHGKDIVFLSISVDEVKDKQKWIDFVKKEGLTGVQLFGGNGFQSDVAKFYKINSIPRFMVFDKQGKIVSDNSPRPSEPSLAKMVDDLLKK